MDWLADPWYKRTGNNFVSMRKLRNSQRKSQGIIINTLAPCDTVHWVFLELSGLFYIPTMIEEPHWLRVALQGVSLVVGWLRLHLPVQGVWVWYPVRKLRSYLLHGQETTTQNRGNAVINSRKTWKMVQSKRKKKNSLKNWSLQECACMCVCVIWDFLSYPEENFQKKIILLLKIAHWRRLTLVREKHQFQQSATNLQHIPWIKKKHWWTTWIQKCRNGSL